MAAQYSAYSRMGHDRSDFEPCYCFSGKRAIYELHCHDFYEFYVHYRGGNLFFVNDTVMPMLENQLFILPPFYMHGLYGEKPLVNYERAFLYVSPSLFPAISARQIDLQRIFSSLTDAGQFRFQLTDEDARAFKRLIIEMEENLDSPSPIDRFSNFSRMIDCMDIIVRAAHTVQEPVAPFAVHDAILEVLRYIDEHYASPIRLADLARRFGVSVSFLSHGFVRYTGRSVYNYVLYRRVQMAKEMICMDMPLNDIAYQCGFNDYSSFMRAFGKIAGMAPYAYRKQIRATRADA